MTIHQRNALWRSLENDVRAASFLMEHAEAGSVLGHLPSAHPAVQAVMHARRHLLRRAESARVAVLTQ